MYFRIVVEFKSDYRDSATGFSCRIKANQRDASGTPPPTTSTTTMAPPEVTCKSLQRVVLHIKVLI